MSVEPRNRDRALLGVMALAAGAIWVYVALRSAALAFTSDESISYGLLHGLNGAAGTANDQWLNQRLMQVSQSLFGQAEWALRLPNVLSFGVYASACLAIVAQLRRTAARATCFAGLMANPFLLEFFGLARGYGISLAFLALAFAVLLTGPRPRTSTQAIRRLGLIGAAGSVAFYANYSVLNFVLALPTVALVDMVLGTRTWRTPPNAGISPSGERSFSRRDLIAVAVIAGATGGILLPGVIRLRHLQAVGQLYYGGHNGFVPDTVGTLVQTWGYVYRYPVAVRPGALTVAWSIAALAALALAFAAGLGVRRRQWDRLQMAALVFAIAVAGALLERVFAGSLYPIDRAALGYVVGFSALAGCAIDAVELEWPLVRRSLSILGAIVVVAAAVNAIRTVNTTSALTWRFDASARAVIDRIIAIRRASGVQRSLKLVAPFPREFAFDYYQQRFGLGWLEIFDPPASTPGADLYDVPPGAAAERGTRLIATLRQDGTQLRAGPSLPVP